MNNYKVCVYAICKNEEKFVEQWYNSMKEADYIVVLDTGSTDNTVKLLQEKEKTIIQQKEITPWRFDVARNESLKLIPNDTDICVCADLDEIFQQNWVEKLKENWQSNTDSAYYTIYWNFSENNIPQVIYKQKKIHKPHEYIWTHAAHEVLEYIGSQPEQEIYIKDLIKEHHADINKSRKNYLNLLKIDVEERPNEDRARHYYARELMYCGRYKEAIEQFKIHLSLPNSKWNPERCASMRYISKCSDSYFEKEKWLYRAIAEAPYLREPYIDMALLQYNLNNWYGIIYFCNKALLIKENNNIYINDQNAWNEVPYDLLSVAYWNTKNYTEALNSAEKAYKLNPYSERIANNVKLIQQYCNKNNEEKLC